jgi:fructose-1-phosphate kinase PfkB-like protein
LFTRVNKSQICHISKGILTVSGGNILFVTFLKFFLESTICSGMMVVAPLLMGAMKISSLEEISGEKQCLELLVLARVDGPGRQRLN